METRCKVCGKRLRDPMSIARGMGPKCAGIAASGKAYHAKERQFGGSAYSSISPVQASTNLFSFDVEQMHLIPETLRRFPSDLVSLVLSAPAAGSIASRVKLYSRRKKDNNNPDPGKLIKQIRRTCIDCRLQFWPGLSANLQPIPCIPHGENDWKLGENGRVISKDELVAYLGRYGIISVEQVGVQASK